MDQPHRWNVSYKPLFIGFIGSLFFTLLSAFLALSPTFSGFSFLILVSVLGGLQALVQLVFFLHLGVEEKPHWNLISFLFAVLVMVLVVGGSLWIMASLNYNAMPPMKM